MAGRKFFFIEAKSFELLRDGSTAGLQIIERGKNRLSKIEWGREVQSGSVPPWQR